MGLIRGSRETPTANALVNLKMAGLKTVHLPLLSPKETLNKASWERGTKMEEFGHR
jgi:hypothetical protein